MHTGSPGCRAPFACRHVLGSTRAPQGPLVQVGGRVRLGEASEASSLARCPRGHVLAALDPAPITLPQAQCRHQAEPTGMS